MVGEKVSCLVVDLVGNYRVDIPKDSAGETL